MTQHTIWRFKEPVTLNAGDELLESYEIDSVGNVMAYTVSILRANGEHEDITAIEPVQ